MLYNPQLETFIRVADAGSFNKAGEIIGISPTALIKQINSLEKSIDLKLFTRTHRGLLLTEAGKSLYNDAKYLIEYSGKALQRAKEAPLEKNTIRIGTSAMTPAQLLIDLWPEIYQHSDEINLEFVSFENTPDNAREILRNLGEQIDIVAGPFDNTLLKLRECSGYEITKEPICCALSVNHPLAQKEKLELKDLYGQNLMVIHRNWSEHMDQIRDEISKNYPQINILDFDFYDINVFNRCERNKDILLVIEKWALVHPMMKVIPVEWDYTIPFGILYSNNPSEKVFRFLRALQKTGKKVIS